MEHVLPSLTAIEVLKSFSPQNIVYLRIGLKRIFRVIPVRQVLNEVTFTGVNLKKDFLEIIAEAINVKMVSIRKSESSELMVELDTNITPSLKLEGIARNLIRNLNNYRKKLNLSTKNRIYLFLKLPGKQISAAIEKYGERIKKMVQAESIVLNVEDKHLTKKFKIDNKTV